MIGSRIVGRARVIASLNASEPAILNDISLESTAWKEPSNTVAPEVDHREPGQEAAHARVLYPLFDRGTYCRGIEPPKMSSTNSKSLPRGRSGSTLNLAVAELAVSAGLLLVPAVRLGRDGNRLAGTGSAAASGPPRRPKRRFQLRDRHFDVQLSLSREQQLVGLRIAAVV